MSLFVVQLVGALVMAFGGFVMIAQVLNGRHGKVVLPAGIEVKLPASLFVLCLGAAIFLFPLTPWAAV